MDSKKHLFGSLLKGLDDPDFDSIINQEELRKQGYSIHFVIDADVIGNYCFPIGLKKKTKEGISMDSTRRERKSKIKDPDYLADEQITLHSLLYLKREREQILFFDEYTPELKGLMYTAASKGQDEYDGSIFKSLKLGSNASIIAELFIEVFSKLFADVLFQVNGLKKLNNVFNNKLLIFDSQDLKDELLQDALDFNMKAEETSKLIENVIIDILSANLYESTSRDASVIDRIIRINNYIQESPKNEKKKNVFIFLSDSSLTRSVFEYIRNTPINSIEYPIIGEGKITLYRTIPQSFAYLISLAYKDENELEIDHHRTIENLRRLKKVNKIIESKFQEAQEYTEIDDLLNSKEFGDLFANYRALRNAFENSGLLQSFPQLYESIKREIKNVKDNQAVELIELLYKQRNELRQELKKKHLKFLEYLEQEASFNTAFSVGITKIRKDQENFDFTKGRDPVEGSYQHLPIFLVSPEKKSEYTKHLNRLIELIIQRGASISEVLIDELRSILDIMIKSKSYNEFPMEVKLMKAFLFIILPSRSSEEKDEHHLIALNWLKSIKIDVDTPALYKADIRYLMCWIKRRMGKQFYKEAADLATQSKTEFEEEDPRFYHGEFLAKYCIFSELPENRQTIEKIDELLALIPIASSKYFSFILHHYPENMTPLILRKIEDNFNNTYSYCYTIKGKIYIEKDQPEYANEYLKKARTKLNLLKDDDKNYREQLPEYYDTEAYLEYWESFQLHGNEAVEKLNNAEIAINKAINFSNHPELKMKYFDRLDMIKAKRNGS